MTGGISDRGPKLGRDIPTQDRQRTHSLQTKRGDVVGGNYHIPKGDFARFLGYAPPTSEEQSGKVPLSPARTIELALQREMNEVGKRAEKTGMSARNMFITQSVLAGQRPANTRDLIAEGLDSVGASIENRTDGFRAGSMGSASSAQYMKTLNEYQSKSREDNMRYLEMQYKFLYASKSFSTVSNLMKVRNEAVRTSMRDVK